MVNKGSEKLFDYVIYALLVIIAVISVFPLLFVVSVSLTPYGEVLKNGGFVVIPHSITFEAYNTLFGMRQIPKAFGVTVFVTVVGTFINLVLSTLMAYPLSRKKLKGRSFFLFYVVFTMLFNGGLIPTYLIVQATGLLNTVWAMIVPTAIATFNLLIMKTFFENLPEEIFESARIDGASETRVLFNIVVPLSIPSMMTVGLFYMVTHWNTFFLAVFYITDQDLNPLQVVVRALLMSSQAQEVNPDITLPTMTLQMASVVLASIPIIAVYPFIQKYLIKGMLIGSIKG